MDNTKGNRIISLDDMERFISNFKCQRCQSLGSYIMTKELFQWIDQSLNITYQCQSCSMSLTLSESNIIEVQTPGCISKTISCSLVKFARAATAIGLSYSQIESLLQSLGIPSPTLSIWNTSVQIASGRNKSCVSDPTYSNQISEVEQVRTEAQSHNRSAVKTEKPNAVDPLNKSNLIMIKEEPPEIDVKEENFNQTNDELFMEYNDEVIVPDVVDSVASKSIYQLPQTPKKGMSDVVDAACMEGSSSHTIETIYIEEKTFGTSTPPNNSSDDENSCQWNFNEITQKNIQKKRHIMTPKRYRDDFYCEDYRNKSSISFVKKIRSKNRYSPKKSLVIDEHLISGFKANKEMEQNFNSDSVNNEKSTFNVEIIAKSNVDKIKNICALCGEYKYYYKNKQTNLFSLIPGFGSITVKIALQILNLPVKKPNCQNFCTTCYSFICTKFKFTLRKKISEQKNIDISEVKLSKIKVRMFDQLDKKNEKPKNATYSDQAASSTASSTMQIQKVVNLNSANEVNLKRKKYLSKKMSESLSQKMMEKPSLTKGLKSEAISSHPIVRLMDISLILPSEVFDGASVLVNSTSDIL